MKNRLPRKHSIGSLFSMMLLGLYTLFILLLLLFFAKAYQTSVWGQEENDNLHTARVYITTKFRQHDQEGQIYPDTLQGMEALCFLDEIDGEEYRTCLYLQDGILKELFSPSGLHPSPDMGTPVAELADFQIEEDESGYYHITLTDNRETRTEFLLHPGAPGEGRGHV